jgi:tRNA A-37 threonylcarbamoyl transferase component Bud32
MIGKGNYGRVFLSPYSYKVCIKYLIDKVQMDSHIDAVVKEHTYLENLHGFEVEGVRAPNVYFKGLKAPPYYLGMERIYGKSLEVIKNDPKDSQDFIEIIKSQKRRDVIFKICSFIKQMHLQKRIIHGDIHLGNIMLDKRGNWYVIDFGLSSRIEFDDNSAELREKDIQKVIETINEVYDNI